MRRKAAASHDSPPDALAHYRKKRNFDRTPEPAGDSTVATPSSDAPRFVVQKHWARRLHYDFRLEIEGTMKSWAVPKGPSLDPTVKRMAVHVEDHPVSYNDFEGTIPEGQYGAGTVIVWDKGHWTSPDDPAQAYRAGKLKFELSGRKLHGRWTLVRMGSRRSQEKQDAWLLIKEKDGHARSEHEFDITSALPDSVAAEPAPGDRGTAAPSSPHHSISKSGASKELPRAMHPQLATRVSAPPRGGDWLYELKYDGYRILARMGAGRARLFTRSGHDWTGRLSSVAEALQMARLPEGWYDGEIVVLDDEGRPDFQALQNALERDPRQARQRRSPPSRGAGKAHVSYFLFDLPWLGGEDLRATPWERRRALLAGILEGVENPVLRFSEAFDAPASDMLASACRLGLEGVIGKWRLSAYVAGRSGHWIKLKCGERQEFVVGGYTDPKGARSGLGSLLLGYYDADGQLRYAGNVGTGFSEDALHTLHRRLRALHREGPPFADAPKGTNVHWVKPRLAAEVAFSQWTGAGRIRHAVFQGLREDKKTTAMKKEQTPRITNPERLVDARSGTSKADVVIYYERIAPLIMPHLKDRPVSLLRAPDGIAGEHFFQKHLDAERMPGIRQLDPALDPGHDPLVVVSEAGGLSQLAQLNVIELHAWNAVRSRIDRPDRISFDLDPGEGVKWSSMQEAAVLLHNFLEELGLPSFLKTSGGKGLHVIVPIVRRYDWDTVKGFSRAVVQHMADVLPQRFSAKSGPRNRVGKIFIDYLRNGFGATTVSAWSLRARPGMGVSVPIFWDEVESIAGGDHWTISNIDQRLDTGNAPWEAYGESAAALGSAMRRLA